VKIGELARQTEGVLSLVHSGKMVLTPDRVRVLLTAAAKLRDLIQNPGTSNQADISQLMAALAGMSGDRGLSTEMAIGPVRHHLPNETPAGGMRLRMLLVEDDFASRLLLQTFLSTYGECHIAVNGKEAVDAVRVFMEQGRRYDLICMDIMMPEMDGREAVHQVRALEEKNGIPSTFGSKIIMTTAVEDMKEVIRCFNELCDGYLMKPIDLNQLRAQMKSCQLIQ
jgi:two-component system chemotaxis response regulator CheY